MPNYALIYFLIGTMALIFALWLLRLRDGQHALNATLALGSIIVAGVAFCNLCGIIGGLN